MDACLIHCLAHPVGVSRLVRLDIDQGAALEVDTAWNAMPEKHREYARDAENEREAEEIPLLAKPVDLYLAKQFHVEKLRLSVYF